MLPRAALPGSLLEILSVLGPCFTSQQYAHWSTGYSHACIAMATLPYP